MTPHCRDDDGPVSGGSLQLPGPRSLPLRSPGTTHHGRTRVTAPAEALMLAPECVAFMVPPGGLRCGTGNK